MWVTDVVMVILLILVLKTFLKSETFKSYWGGVETVWHQNLQTPYSTQIDEKLYVFNPTGYNR